MYEARDAARRKAVAEALNHRIYASCDHIGNALVTEAFNKLVADPSPTNLVCFRYLWQAVSNMVRTGVINLDVEQSKIYDQLLITFDAHTI